MNKNIIQTAPSFGILPEKIKNNIEYLKQNNKDWNYMFFDDDDMIQEIKDYDIDINILNKKYGAMIADIFRYIVVQKYGGVYLDIKSTCYRKFSTFINSSLLLVTWPPFYNNKKWNYVGLYDKMDSGAKRGEIANWFFYSDSDNIFFKYVLDELKKRIYEYSVESVGTGKDAVLYTTGPAVLTDVAIKHNKYSTAQAYTKFDLEYSVYGPSKMHYNVYTDTHYSKLDEPLIIG